MPKIKKKHKGPRRKDTSRAIGIRVRKDKRRDNHTKYILGKLKPQWEGIHGEELEVSNKENLI